MKKAASKAAFFMSFKLEKGPEIEFYGNKKPGHIGDRV